MMELGSPLTFNSRRLARRQPNAMKAKSSQPHAETDEPQPTVFLVEDDEKFSKTLQWVLLAEGYRVVASANTTEALDRFEPDAHGCLVLDVHLPQGNGIELVHQLRARGGRQPFIVMTGFSKVPMAVEAMKLGAIDFFEKPFDNRELARRVGEAIRKDAENRLVAAEAKQIAQRLRVLSRREWQIAELLATGQSSKEIGLSLSIAPKTVQAHRHNLLKKLDADSSAQVVALVTRARALSERGHVELPNG